MKLPTDIYLAKLQMAAYDPNFPWDYALPGDKVRGGIKFLDGYDAIIFPGTEDVNEWMSNFDAVPTTVADHLDLGPIHRGFWDGMEAAAILLETNRRSEEPAVMVGHSRGAAHAALYAVMTADIDRLVLMGCPRPGSVRLMRALQDTKIPVVSYRNTGSHAHDFVTDVPFHMLGAPFCPVWSYTDVVAEPPAGSGGGVFAYHHMALYAQGIQKLIGA